MIQKTTTICNKLGLHARAASKLVQTAQEFGAAVTLDSSGKKANGKSIMSVLMLGARQHTSLVLQTDGDDEERAMHALIALIEDRFGEDE